MLAEAVHYVGHTAEHRRVVVEVRGRAVVAVTFGITRYRCADFGDIGPLVVRERGRAAIGRDGGFRFTAGEIAERITVAGVLRSGKHRITGTVRLHGSMATGQRCASATLRFTASR